MSTIPAISFTGISQFATDFQSILSKAAQVAQIPVTQLQNQDSTVLQKETALGTLSTNVAALATSVSSLGNLAANQALSATSSNPDVVSVANSGATAPVSYTINSITSAAAAASETSIASYADSSSTQVSTTGSMELIVGSNTYHFTLTNNSLVGVRDQINSLGAGVTASILTTGNGNYLSVSANNTGQTTLKLMDDPGGANTDILTSSNQGTNAVFQLNGINVSQPGNVVNGVIPGVTFTILGASASPVTLSLASDPSQLSSALQDFVANYNTLQQNLVSQLGISGGALGGDTVLNQIRQTLQQMTSYTTSTGTVRSLSDLGIEFTTGQASFNQTTFDSLSATQIADGFKFIGSATSGLGGFSTQLSQYSDPISGLITSEQNGLRQTDQDLQSQIGTLNTRISAVQASLTKQFEAADAQQEMLQQQQQMLTASLQGLSLVLYGKNASQLG